MKCLTRRLALVAGLAALTGFGSAAMAATVYANGAAPGDAFTNAGTINQGQAVGATGWYYNNVRNGGTAGIDTSYARSGNGSAHLSGTAGPSGFSHKADIEFLAGGLNFSGNYVATASLGKFSTFTGMSYDWYRSGSSSNSAAQHPALRILLDMDGNLATTGDRGGLVFERAYNVAGNAPTDVWVSDVVTSSSKLWNFGFGLGLEFDIDGDGTPYDTLAEWQADGRFVSAAILGFSAGIGSGWGPFDGAVDNIAWTIGNQSMVSNFEVQASDVPEPASLALVGLSLAALAMSRRRKG